MAEAWEGPVDTFPFSERLLVSSYDLLQRRPAEQRSPQRYQH